MEQLTAHCAHPCSHGFNSIGNGLVNVWLVPIAFTERLESARQTVFDSAVAVVNLEPIDNLWNVE